MSFQWNELFNNDGVFSMPSGEAEKSIDMVFLFS